MAKRTNDYIIRLTDGYILTMKWRIKAMSNRKLIGILEQALNEIRGVKKNEEGKRNKY